MDVDDVKEPVEIDDEDDVDLGFSDDPLVPGAKKKPKKADGDDDSLEDLADEEDGLLAEDLYDDHAADELWS